jgi:Kef-type K+ transport system membrane component KefB
MTGFLLPLALVLVASEVGGWVSDRLGLTRVAGQIGVGLIIGPSLLGWVAMDSSLELLASLGALCVLAIAGLETDFVAIRSVGRPAFLAAVGGVILPFVLGAGVTRALGYDIAASLFAGAILTATSVGVSAATLRELGLSRSRTGQTILGAAIIDDILGLMVLGLVLAATNATGTTSPLLQFSGMFAVLVGAGAAVYFFRHRVVELLHHFHLRGGGIAGLVGLMLAVAWVFEAWGGLAAITGAYVAGVAVSGSHMADGLRERLVHAGEAFAIPVFLVAIGLSVDLRAAPGMAVPMLALLAVGVVGKLIGSGLGARLGGLGSHSSMGVGIGMIARGEVALVASAIGLKAGVIDEGLYSAAVMMTLATTIMTPLLLAFWAARISLAGIAADIVSGPTVAPVTVAHMDAE